MDAFPVHYVDHNLPLLLVSGLQEDGQDGTSSDGSRSLLQEGGFRLRTDLPPVEGQASQYFLRSLLDCDSSKNPWNGKYVSQAENKTCFRIKSIGRLFTLPPRKAPPPPHSPRMAPAGGSASPPPPMVLHSVLSPLTPSSPLYADGIMSPIWIAKHQSRLPSVFIAAFALSSDANTSTLLDNRIKSEISNIRSVFSSANYKTKLVVILVGHEGLLPSDAEERVVSIRRATSFDNKSLYYLSGDASSADIKNFTRGLLGSLHSASIEYYRDLSKHARRKRSRNVVPQPTVQPAPGTSQLLPIRAWNLRYEFKLGIFAEFRQEMDAALRNYEAAYENLFTSEVFEAIPAWSPRFNEARLLSDVIAIRIIRCLLWLGQTTSAVKWWSNHRSSTRSLVSRRGGGVETYTWETWQSVWAKTMASLISRSHILPPTDFEHAESVEKSILVHSEKTLPANDKFAPWESLHHEGYWLNLAQRFTGARRTRAQQIPEDDRVAPGNSPASAIASRAHVYDSYLSFEPHVEYPVGDRPGFDYTEEITTSLDAATQHFSQHSQIRMIQILQLQKAVELMRSSQWQDAVEVLTPLWLDIMLRKAGWWTVLQAISRALWTCAVRTDNYQVLLQMIPEMVHPLLAADGDLQSIASDVLARLEIESRPSINLNPREHLSSINAQFAFAAAECHVGEGIDVQLCLQRLMSGGSRIIRPTAIQIEFEGPLPSIHFVGTDSNEDNESDPECTLITDLDLEKAGRPSSSTSGQLQNNVASALTAEVDLSLRSGYCKILQFRINPREAGDISVASITIHTTDKACNSQIQIPQSMIASEKWWETQRGKVVSRPYGKNRDVIVLKVFPKPPKLEINVPALKTSYYTDEDISLKVEFVNQEEEIINGSIDARLISPTKNAARMRWCEPNQEQTESTLADSTELVQALSQKKLSDVAVGEKLTNEILLDQMQDAVDHELEIAVTYTLPSSPLTLLHKQLTIDLAIIRPFEANFGFHSRHHPEVWPCFFSMESISKDRSRPAGLKQQFSVSAFVSSFAVEDLIIKETQLTTSKVLGDAICTTSTGIFVNNEPEKILIRPEQNQQIKFDMIIQKHTLGDRQPVAVDFQFHITWKRASKDAEIYHNSILQVPRFLAPSSEPRVLLQVMSPPSPPASAQDARSWHLVYTLENPSLHFLTFNLTMEASDEFAFSGPKQDSVSLVPISRTNVKYQITPTYAGNKAGRSDDPLHDAKEWMQVHLDVVDAYFGQTLRVQPASEGVRVDKSGNVLVRLV